MNVLQPGSSASDSHSPIPHSPALVCCGHVLTKSARSVDAAAPPQNLRLHQKFAVARKPLQQSHAQKPATHFENTVLGETLGLQTNKHGRHLGLTSPFEPMLIGLSTFDSRNESILSLGTLRRVNDNETFIMFSDDTTLDYGDDAEALEVIDQIVYPHGPALLDLYFRIVHPSFPIVQKHVFLERVRSGDRKPSPPLLAGMYILALNWWSYDRSLSKHPKPDLAQLDAVASKSLAAAMQRPKLSTVQAGLLLLQRPEADSWSLTTQLVAIGQELGLHLDCSNWSIPLWERGLRKRIAWALYMQDKWSSLIHGRPSHIFSANWAVQPLVDEDSGVDSQANPSTATATEDEIADHERGQVLFSQMISLTAIMAEVMDTFYTQVAIQDFANAGTKSTRIILERAKPVQIKLKDWFGKLPLSLRMDDVQKGRLSPTG
jgi:Fungal specific transcription factor domain